MDRVGSAAPCEQAPTRSAQVGAADRSREQRVQHEIERLTDAVAQIGLSTALAERLRKTQAERDAPRAVLGDVRLIEENGSVYAECDSAAERLLLAIGGVPMGRVAGVRNRTHLCIRIRSLT
jgi:hypothetical protein